MIKLEKTTTHGWEEAIRGMRNPMNSWGKSDSIFIDVDGEYHDILGNQGPACGAGEIGDNDRKLMRRLAKAGSEHSKYRRMITVYVDITAPLYWWKEFDTYKVGTTANSCSTMHKIAAKPFELDDFSWDHLLNTGCDLFELKWGTDCSTMVQPQHFLIEYIIPVLNVCLEKYLETKDKKYWWQMIQLLPSSYNQKRTVMLNYEVIAAIVEQRKGHKLDEWHDFIKWAHKLPLATDIIFTEEDEQ